MTKVVTGQVRLSYANVWEPKAINGGDPKYSTSIIIPKKDKKTIQKIEDAIAEAIEDGFESGKFKKGKAKSTLKTPLRDGDVERPDDKNYADSMFMNLNSVKQPGIVDRAVQPILDQSEVYSGCYARVSMNLFAYNSNGNTGIGAGLNNIQKLADGEPLGGGSTPDQDFGNVDDEDDEDW